MATIIHKDGTRKSPAALAVQPVTFSFSDLRGQADDYLETVRGEAAKIVQQAHRDAERIRRKAEVEGRKAAEAAVERVLDEKVARRMDTLVPALEQLVRQINDAKGEMQSHWERSALQVATAIAARIIRRELKHDPQITLDSVLEALRLAMGSADITLHISPTDYENLGSQIERLAATLCQLSPSQIVADATIEPGGCRVETRFGEVDLQIESQLQRIEEDLASQY
jgi:flagellar assembly protein FliH